MDTDVFDRLTRMLSATPMARRGAVQRLLASALGLAFGAAIGAETAAKKGKKKKKKKKPAPPPPGCSGDENYCLDDAPCGSPALGCECAAGTEGTICAAPSGGQCYPKRDMCQVDADCDQLTGPGSVCTETLGGCTCGGVTTGFNACVPPCGAARVYTAASSGRLGCGAHVADA